MGQALSDNFGQFFLIILQLNKSVNLTFDWGTIGIIIGAVVGLIVVIFAIAFFCGRGCGFCCDNVCCKGKALVNQNKARKAREQQEIIRAVADGIVGAQNATISQRESVENLVLLFFCYNLIFLFYFYSVLLQFWALFKTTFWQ